MPCINHPDVPDVRDCATCRRPFCESCRVSFQNQVVCAACKNVLARQMEEGAAAGTRLALAGIGRRWVAALVDGLLTMAVFFVLAFGAAMVSPMFVVLFGNQLTWSVLYALVEGWFLSQYSATPGKMLLGIRVVRPDNTAISTGDAFKRSFSKILSQLILCIGYLIAFWDSEKRTLHDRIANTRVVRV